MLIILFRKEILNTFFLVFYDVKYNKYELALISQLFLYVFVQLGAKA